MKMTSVQIQKTINEFVEKFAPEVPQEAEGKFVQITLESALGVDKVTIAGASKKGEISKNSTALQKVITAMDKLYTQCGEQMTPADKKQVVKRVTALTDAVNTRGGGAGGNTNTRIQEALARWQPAQRTPLGKKNK